MTTRNEDIEANFAAALGRATDQRAAPAIQGMRQGRKTDHSLFLLAIDRIRPDEDQVRRAKKSESDPDMVELADSIRQFGVMEPLNVRYIPHDDIYELVAGERRYIASRMVGLSELPVKLIEADERQARLRQLHENIHRENLHPLDLAAALQAMVDEGSPIDELATLLNKSTTFVQKALAALKDLSPEAKATVGEAPDQFRSLDHLYEASRLPAEQQVPILEKVKEGISRKELRRETAAAKAEHKKQRGENRGRPTKSKPYSKSFSTSLGGKVTVSFRKTKVTPEEVRGALQEVLDSLGERFPEARTQPTSGASV